MRQVSEAREDEMTTPLLSTKLYIPPLRPELVSRPRLTERLNAGLHRKLTLVSAPAGFGKTTLLREKSSHPPNPRTPRLTVAPGSFLVCMRSGKLPCCKNGQNVVRL